MENYNDIIDKLSNWNFKKIVLFPEGSNYVFLVKLQSDKNHKDEIFAIYKPVSGERPLRDFPDRSLYLREKFAWIISTQLGWPNLPPLVIRDGPYGLGSLQFYVNSFTTKNYFTERDSRLEDFIYIAAFDVLVNNSDRKASSCLIDKNDKKIWAIDHGLTFNYFSRIRTVMFEFIGRKYPLEIIDNINKLVYLLENDKNFIGDTNKYISDLELKSLINRGKNMVETGSFPNLDSQTNIPWPLL